jgi:hypothetical protein
MSYTALSRKACLSSNKTQVETRQDITHLNACEMRNPSSGKAWGLPISQSDMFCYSLTLQPQLAQIWQGYIHALASTIVVPWESHFIHH